MGKDAPYDSYFKFSMKGPFGPTPRENTSPSCVCTGIPIDTKSISETYLNLEAWKCLLLVSRNPIIADLEKVNHFLSLLSFKINEFSKRPNVK